ncbi:hypothetical protein MYSTI_01718 [Myxococcus stipitatus DSM 14675]|uniref:AAA+ ATPase domain-containing protein n=1 Tax=Myxococcus stipitatus (strain DSM 14675 / JCM 12634 / Mx s8) TaxID=1278073 RepID=L7U5E5_MYXSD|nr:ATP-binding protein [Myxococcus stipitatus]AGC43050.1 hypothetical protein MYSTI_01718 [Myxococcus stipitatus DSM 14675]
MSSDPRLEVFLSDGGEVFSGVQQGQYLWQPDPFDVETLSAPARRAFTRLLGRATTSPPPDTGKLLLLLGESGCGKTHLVRAFRNLAHGQQCGFTGYMPMTVDATHYDRYLLSNLIDSLDHPYDVAQGDDSGLMHLSNLLMAQCTSLFAPLIEHEQKILEDDELHGTVRAVADELLADPRFRNVEVDLLRALIYFQRRDPRINRRLFNWLRCEDIAPEDRKVIGELVPRTSDDSAARMVEQLGRLMGALDHALVLCVDQVEDISDFEQRPQMESSFRRAIATLAAIAGKVPRAVVVVCCLSDYWEKMRPLLTRSMVDRIENDPEPVMLERTVTADTARDIAARRLRYLYEQRDVAFDPTDPTYPIPAKGFDALGGQRARDVLNECRRYRERAIEQQLLPDTFPLPHPTRGPAVGTQPPGAGIDLEQAWTDFRAAYKEKLPEDASDISALVAWAVEMSSEELGGSPRFTVKPRNGNDLLDIGEHPSGNKFVLALCDRSSKGGGLGRQMADALKAAAGSTPVLIRTSDFPSSTGTIVSDQLGKLVRQGGRRVVLGDSELRDLVAMRDFRALHVGQPSFAAWSRSARPITRLKSMGDILGLERLGRPAAAGTSSPKPQPPRPVEATGFQPRASPRNGLTAGGQTQMFNDAATTPFGRALPVPPREPGSLVAPTPVPPVAPTPVPLRVARADTPAPNAGLANNDADLGPFHLEPAGQLLPEQEPRVPPPAAVPGGLKPRPRSTPASGTPIPSEVLTGALKLGSSEGLLSQPISLEPSDLTRHSAFLGGTGSGKTTLALNILEQLLLRGIPVILIDRKGDLATYARAESWAEPLEDAALRERRRLLRERVDVALYTPGRSDGRPLAIPVVPHGLESLPAEDRDQSIQQAADAIAGMLDYRTSPNDKAAKAVLAQALRLLMNQSLGKEVTLELLQQFIIAQDPALLEATDGIPTRTFAKLAQDLSVLRINLRTMLSTGGERLDLDELLGRGVHGVPGRTRLSIISTKFLGDNSRILFWVSQLLLETLRWASQHPSSKLQAVLLFDEADMYLPATSKPATKEPMESLLRRARSAGVGVMLATQSPGDFDYKCRENVQSWFVGKIKEENALKRVRSLFADSRVDADARLPGQKPGQFHVLSDGRVQQLKADCSVFKTTQLPEDQILELARLSRKQSGSDTP